MIKKYVSLFIELAEIYDTTQENISMHISNIYRDEELDENRTYKKFLLVRREGQRQVKRNIDHYNLDMGIAWGYRVQSQIATHFRRWAPERLHEYIQYGICNDLISYHIIPFTYGQLAGNNRCLAAVSIFYNLHKQFLSSFHYYLKGK